MVSKAATFGSLRACARVWQKLGHSKTLFLEQFLTTERQLVSATVARKDGTTSAIKQNVSLPKIMLRNNRLSCTLL